jgi:hypothetical protein
MDGRDSPSQSSNERRLSVSNYRWTWRGSRSYTVRASVHEQQITRGERVTPAKSNRGRPIVHTEPWAKITVVLLDRHVAYLDRLAIDIRLKHGKAISRAEIIRGLIEAAFQSGIDLSQADSIDTLVGLLTGSTPKRKTAR